MTKQIRMFIGLAYTITWLLWLPMALNASFQFNLPYWHYQYYLGSFGPLLAALITLLWSEGWSGTKDWMKKTFHWRGTMKSMGVTLVTMLIYGIVGLTVHFIVTGSWVDFSMFGLTSKLPELSVIQTLMVWIITFGFGEESGWRGFLLGELRQKYSLRISALWVALFWILWHLPAFLFNENYQNMGFAIFGWMFSLVMGSMVLAWLSDLGKGSLWPIILWHAGFDFLTASDQSAEVIAMVCSLLVIVQGVLLMRYYARRELKEESDVSASKTSV